MYNPSKPVDYPESTPQQTRVLANFAGQLNHTQSEDCLTLNVWSKLGGRRSKPVFVYFYGGSECTLQNETIIITEHGYQGWSLGESNTPFYKGKRFADHEDVVVVTLNYRLSIFGFPGAPDGTQNLGLLDQRLAVEWVRDNIQGFGGDPNKIVLFGQSSGSVAVDYWSYAYRNDPIASGLISHSANAFSFPINSQELAGRNWYNVSSSLGCGGSGDVMPCMRRQNITDIKAAVAKVKPPPGSSVTRSQPVFQPTPDGRSVFDDYESLLASGAYARLPYLAGENNNEAGYYKIPAFAQGKIPTEEQWNDLQLESFTCPLAKVADSRAKRGVPVWRFRYFGDWDNLRLYPTSGAYHGSDVAMIFGSSEAVSGLPESRNQTKLEALMMKAWAAFGDDPVEGLKTTIGWPEYDSNGRCQRGFWFEPFLEPPFFF